MNKPHIICHMLTSLDGKITGDYLATSETESGLLAYETTHASFHATACLAGRISMEENFTFFQKPVFDAIPAIYYREDYIAEQNLNDYLVVIDTSGKIAWQTNIVQYMERPPAHIIEILTHKATDEYISYLRKYQISYLFAGDSELDLPLALDKLYRLFEIKTLIVSGGGRTNGYFLRKNLIDEISIIVVPVISGDDNAVALFTGADNLPTAISTRFKLNKVETLEGSCIWMRYHDKHQ